MENDVDKSQIHVPLTQSEINKIDHKLPYQKQDEEVSSPCAKKEVSSPRLASSSTLGYGSLSR